MNVNSVSYPTVNDFPLDVQKAAEMKSIETTISQMNEAHEERKKETDEITNNN